MIAFEVGYIEKETFDDMVGRLNKVQKMLVNFNKHLNNK